MAPDLFHKCQKNCVNPLKSLRLSDFPFDGLITPTFQAFPVEIRRKALQQLELQSRSGERTPPLTTI